MSIDMPDDFSTSSARSSMITSDWSPVGACIFSGLWVSPCGGKKKKYNFIKLTKAETYKKREMPCSRSVP